MSAETIRQFAYSLDRQQAEFLATVEEDGADNDLHRTWWEGVIKHGSASEKPTRMQQSWPAYEDEAERRYREAKTAVAAVPQHLQGEWLDRLARMFKAHKRLLSHCVAATTAVMPKPVDHDLVQDCRELRDEAVRELNALQPADVPSGPPPAADRQQPVPAADNPNAGSISGPQEPPQESQDGPTGFMGFRLDRWRFCDLTPTDMRLLERLWNEGRFRGDEGYVTDSDAAKAVYGELPHEFAEKLDAARKRLSHKLAVQSEGAVSISSRRDHHGCLHYRLEVNTPAGTNGGQRE